MDGDSKKMIYAIAAACILVIIIVGALALFSHISKGFSELYFENPDDLPRHVNIGDRMKLEFTVVSHEMKRCNYRYNVTYDDRIIKSGSFVLMPEESNSNRNTIEVDLIPNISSLVKMNSPNIEISRIRYNNTLVSTMHTEKCQNYLA
jgi:hypothetical protein